VNRHLFLTLPLAFIAVTLPAGCAGLATPDRDQPPVGKINPWPAGCLYMEFFAPTDDSRVVRGPAGQVTHAITPINRHEPLTRKWTVEEFEKAVRDPDEEKRTSMPKDASAATVSLNSFPGPEAWNYVKRYLRPGDELWTFGVLDTGFVVLRQGKLWCMVVTCHQM
jgi:hypothetical protein